MSLFGNERVKISTEVADIDFIGKAPNNAYCWQ